MVWRKTHETKRLEQLHLPISRSFVFAVIKIVVNTILVGEPDINTLLREYLIFLKITVDFRRN